MRVVIVEDDYLQAEWIRELVKERVGIDDRDIDMIATELDFRRQMPRFRANPPNLFLMDVMLRWTNPEPEQEAPPEDVKKESYFRAGLRCEQLLRDVSETKDVRVILYTVLEESDLKDALVSVGSRTWYVGKSSDDSDLVMQIKELAANL